MPDDSADLIDEIEQLTHNIVGESKGAFGVPYTSGTCASRLAQVLVTVHACKLIERSARVLGMCMCALSS